MSEHTYWKARTFLNRDMVTLEDAEGGNLLFFVNGHEVFRTSKGHWSCNARNKSKGDEGGCVLFGNKNKGFCSHVMACKLWLEQYKQPKERPLLFNVDTNNC